jgi:hypothetical protein
MRKKLEQQVETILLEHKIKYVAAYVAAYLTDEELIRIVCMTNIERILFLQDFINSLSTVTRMLKHFYSDQSWDILKPNPLIIKP